MMTPTRRQYAILGCSFLLTAAPAFGQEWNGHLAKLSDAQLACENIHSSSCLPFLGEAVAVADTLSTQARAQVGNSKNITIQLRLWCNFGASVCYP
jgi:hypothetical protein